MRSLGERHGHNDKSKGSVSGCTIARGCNILLRRLFDRAIRSAPELVVVDYLSETLIDVARLNASTKKLNYNVSSQLKKKSCTQDSYT